MKKRLVEKFQARGLNGKIYTVHIYEAVIEFKPITGPSITSGGSKVAALSDGRHVNWIDDETFQILDNDEIIKRV